jgi:ketosteroid isomerase-like protein
MRTLLLSLIVFVPAGDRTSDRDALLAADRALSDKTAAQGMVHGFLPSLTEDAAYLYPGAPLLRGSAHIRMFFESADSLVAQPWTPEFADVSADGKLGYTYGWTHAAATRGKYLACWQKSGRAWRLAAYAHTRPMPVTDSITTDGPGAASGAQVRGRADPGELLHADSAFAALSVTSGAKQAFITFAAEDAIAFGGGPDMTRGRQAIGAGFDGFPAGAVLEWWPVAAEIAPSGDLGCTIGEAKIASLNRYSKYLTIWRRQPDRTWRFVADGGSARPAP